MAATIQADKMAALAQKAKAITLKQRCHGCFGIQTASATVFSTPFEQLKWGQDLSKAAERAGAPTGS